MFFFFARFLPIISFLKTLLLAFLQNFPPIKANRGNLQTFICHHQIANLSKDKKEA